MPKSRHFGSQIKARRPKILVKEEKRYEWGGVGGRLSEREKEEKIGGWAVYGLGSQPNPHLNPISTNKAM